MRWLIAALIALVAAALAWLLIAATESALAVWGRLDTLPGWTRMAFLAALGVFGLGAGVAIWRVLHPGAPRAPKAAPIDRDRVERRLDALPGDHTAELARELAASDARRAGGRLHVAVFGDISTGKSALVSALAPGAAQPVDVVGGTTHAVHEVEVVLADGLALALADVPGSNEVDGDAWARLAHVEAARAHALVYVADGDLTRSQAADLRRIGAFGKPVVLALNKSDRYRDSEIEALAEALQRRYRDEIGAVVAVQAGGVDRLRRESDGGVVERPRAPRIEPLLRTLRAIARRGPEGLEAARETAVLASVDSRLGELEDELRATRALEIVRGYTRRAVIGALAAIAPGTDLLIQGALATAMLRALAELHGLRVRDLDLDALIGEASGMVRTTTSVTLAIAGNALKAFPGLGTLGGGLVHAVAYGLIFDSLGRAVARTLANTAALDREATLRAFAEELERPSRERLAGIVALAREALGETRAAPERAP
ncbi:GTPase domain-containing protein [Coralloluteibacterium stylophorae]|uniref:GTPase domain-containing protein n=1 Tax=Coralloluteibacterium stylophorae TaxID=1776034 RepID=A0A8J7VSI7_9GAMM|nr:GTPase domain-containing protein [Coralloluteibacterium stylophorae]MBS7456402.1 GTPase domain-containing protein [Coralloluteibacterium stylophorae]